MELRQLKYFIGIVDAGSLTRAAQHLHIAQPALSAQIVNLEAELGVQLLVRSVRGVSCTDAGATFYKHAQHVLRSCRQAVEATRRTGADIAGAVSVGLPSSVIANVGLSLLSQLAVTHPNIRLELTDSPSAFLVELLVQGRMDLAVLFTADAVKGAVCETLFTESLLFVRRSEGAPLIAPEVPLSAIAAERMVLPVRPNALRLQVDAAFASRGFEPQLAGEISSMATLAQTAASGVAATVCSWSTVARELDAGLVTAQKIVDPEISRTLALGRPDAVPLSATATVVYQGLRSLLEQLVHDGTWRGARWIAPMA